MKAVEAVFESWNIFLSMHPFYFILFISFIWVWNTKSIKMNHWREHSCSTSVKLGRLFEGGKTFQLSSASAAQENATQTPAACLQLPPGSLELLQDHCQSPQNNKHTPVYSNSMAMESHVYAIKERVHGDGFRVLQSKKGLSTWLSFLSF